MWPETREDLANRMMVVNDRAKAYNRTLDYGLRIHMVVRDTETEAREFAQELVSRLDENTGKLIRERALDSNSLGVSRQSRNRDLADMDGFIEPHLWTGIGRARSGCGAALVGSADQVIKEIKTYQKMGIRSFIFSGYPHLEECDYVGKLVLPELKTCSLPDEYGRMPPGVPKTPLGNGSRK
jgi:alkanesulfonate monooxygenase